MLLFALTLRRDSGTILEVEVPGSERHRSLDGSVAALAGGGDASMLTEDLPDGSGGARQTQTKRLELRILGEEIEDGFGTRDALEMSRRSITNGKDALDDEGLKTRRRLDACSRAAVKDEFIIGKGGAEALSPFLDPGEGAAGSSNVVLTGPDRMKAEQGAKQRAIGEPAVLHRCLLYRIVLGTKRLTRPSLQSLRCDYINGRR
jgi:hypothetical protein